MLTKVRLDGVMGKKFGKEWELDVSSPAEALRMIEANKPGLNGWIVQHREKYDAYRVVCTYHDGREEFLDDNTFPMLRGGLKSIRFTPTVSGASGIVKAVVGVALLIATPFLTAINPLLGKIAFNVGVSLTLGGVIEMLSPQPKTKEQGEEISSYYFDGPVNTERQGSPVPLIYGRVLAGSHPVSASISIDEVAI